MLHPCALIVFFKVPEVGKVKTRLSPPLSLEDATCLYACFVEDVFEKVCLKAFDVFGFVSGNLNDVPEWISFFAEKRVHIEAQVGADLGERMSNAFRFCFEHGYERVCIIGTDSPDMPLSIVEQAFEILSSMQPTVAIAGADDGGYALLGMNRYFPEAFEHVPYSTHHTYAATLAQLQATRATIIELPKWYDVDTMSDLRRLIQTPFPNLIPKTLNFLLQHATIIPKMKLTIGVTDYTRKALPPYETKTDEYIAWLKSGEAFGYEIDCVKLFYEGESIEELKSRNLDLLKRLDAIVFSGGPDVEPSFFGVHLSNSDLEKLHVRSVPKRDDMEIALAKASIEQGVPVLGICRGLQLVNVAMGGTLILDIGQETGSHIHEAKGPEESNYHLLTLDLKSKLGRMIGKREGEVSTRHHQAAKVVASGLSVVSRSADGIIEALESEDDRPIFLVQWHPERMWLEGRDNAFSQNLLKGFLNVVAERKRATATQLA